MYQVSPIVNNSRNNRAECVKPVSVKDWEVRISVIEPGSSSGSHLFYSFLISPWYTIHNGEECMPNLADRITVNPKQCGGRPCIRGMRIRVTDVLDLLANGLTPQEVLQELPDLKPEDVQACLKFASGRLDHPVVVV